MQARLGDEVAIDRGADGRDVADVLNHGRERKRHDRNDSRDGKPRIEVAREREDRVLEGDRQADPRSGGDAREVNFAERNGEKVGHEHAEQDRDNLHHAATPDVRYDDDGNRHDSDKPVRRGVRDGGAREDKADRDDDRACDHGREELHHAKRAEAAEERGEHEVQKTRARHAQASIGQKLGLAVRCDSGIARDEGERRAKECRHLPLREEVEQKRAQAREQKRGRNGEAREHRN